MSEPSSTSTCQQCGKQKRPLQSGTMTGWIFDESHCRCDAEFIERDWQAATKSLICAHCNKPIARGRKASITQWIFQSAKCTCAQPKPVTKDACELDSEDYDPSSMTEELEEAAQVLPERYVPIRHLGRGSVSLVCEAKDNYLNRKVAIKIFERNVMQAEQVIRFQSEAKIISRLNHPNIVDVYDFGINEAGKPFMVLEYITGTTLRHVIESQGRLSNSEARQVFAGVASALAYAHENGFNHRDLKPDNMIIHINARSEMEAKIIDFGLAKFVNAQDGFTTASGIALTGTPAYMSPDQANGAPYDERSEIYSFGCVLFEALTGRPPFAADSPLELLAKHCHEEAPRLGESDASIDEELSRLVEKCLSKSPDDRFQSFEEILEVLENPSLLAKSAVGAAGPGKPQVPVIPLAIAFVVLAIPLAFVSTVFKSKTVPQTGQQTQAKESESQNVSDFLNDVSALVKYSPEEKLIKVEGHLKAEDFKRILSYPEARHLDVSHVLQIDTEAFKSITKLPLESISLYATDAGDEIVHILTEIPTLEKVNLIKTRVSDKGLAELSKLKALKKLEIDQCVVSDAGIGSLANCHSLEFLSMRNLGHVLSKKGLVPLRTLPLKNVICSGNVLQDDDIRVLAQLRATHYSLKDAQWNDHKLTVFQNPRARFIDIGDNDISLDGVKTILSLPVMASISLTERGDVTPAAVAALQQSLKTHCKVKFVPPRKSNKTVAVEADEMSAKTKAVPAKTAAEDETFSMDGIHNDLKALNLISENPEQNDALNKQAEDKLLHVLSQVPSVRSANFEGSNVSDQGLAEISGLPEMRELNLNSCRLTDVGISSLWKCTKLERLSIDKITQLSKRGLHALRKLPLKSFSCSDNKLKDEDIQELSLLQASEYRLVGVGMNDGNAALFQNKTAKSLDLRGNDITLSGLNDLLKLPSIEKITLSPSARLTPKAIEKLKQSAGSKCEILVKS